MGRRRLSRLDLPQRVYFIHGAYYFFVKGGKPIHLGRDFAVAMAQWASLVGTPKQLATLADVMDRYLLEVAPLKAPRTYKDNIIEMRLLRAAFGHMRPNEVTPPDVYAYMDARGAPVRANREKALLSSVFSHAIRWGVAASNPCRLVKRNPEKRRERLPEVVELRAFKAVAGEFLAAYIDLKYMTGLRKGDLLSLRLENLTDEGIALQQRKNRKRLVILWTPDLREVVARAQALPRRAKSAYLFATHAGKPYSTSGFDSIWQRTMRRALSSGILAQRFTEHDIRAATGSADPQNAQARLGQKNKSSTDAYLRSKAVTRIEPLPKNI